MSNHSILGLHYARAQLERLPVAQRSIRVLDMKGVYALFEALSCKPFVCNEQLLIEYFDPPFQMVQTNKRLILQTYLPATTHFLFSSDHGRREWATSAWAKMKRSPTINEFDWAIREPLLAAMGRVQIQNIEIGFPPTFWSGLRLILSRLNKDIVTHAVRGMEYDIYKLVLDHLQLDSSGYLDVVRALGALITLSPSDFWDSMNSISPATIAEQIFGSDVMEFILADAIDKEKVKVLAVVLAWVTPFMASIKASNRTPACRALIHQLMDRCQEE
jgi:senataxin